MVNALLRDIMRKLSENSLNARREELVELPRQAVNQKRQDKIKFTVFTNPYSKSKEHKKYEFGAKAAIAMTKTGCVIDGDTLKELLS